jgi:hypothetical protein
MLISVMSSYACLAVRFHSMHACGPIRVDRSKFGPVRADRSVLSRSVDRSRVLVSRGSRGFGALRVLLNLCFTHAFGG